MTRPLPQPDPFIVPILDRMRAAAPPDLTAIPAAEGRAAFEVANGEWNADPIPIKTVQNLSVPGAASPLRARLYCDTEARPVPVLIFVHGGGWVVGSIDTHDDLLRRFARASGCAVLGFDYRLAPEHPFPEPLDDVLAVIRFVEEGGLGAGFDTTGITLGGESAGANLALAALLARRKAGLPPIKAAALFFGCYAPDFGTESYARFGDGSYGLSTTLMRWFWAQYLGKTGSPSHLAAPLNAELAGLPPLYLTVGGLDLLLDDTLALSRRLAAANVPHRLDFHPGVIHGFIQMARALPAGQAAIDAAAEFLTTDPLRGHSPK